MSIEERRQYVLDRLKESSSVSVTDLSHAFGVSEVSVRKLLEAMQRDGQIRRTWGGAVSRGGALQELSYAEKFTRNLEEKQAIARTAYGMIADGDAVFLDNGTTTLELARLIVRGPKRGILVCTNTVNIAMELGGAPDIQVILTGGTLRHNVMSCVGALFQDAISQLRFDRCFSSCSRFSAQHGFSTANLAEAEAKRLIIRASKESVMLADTSKFGDDSLAQIAPLGGVDVTVTDWKASPHLVREFEERDLRLVIAPRTE